MGYHSTFNPSHTLPRSLIGTKWQQRLLSPPWPSGNALAGDSESVGGQGGPFPSWSHWNPRVGRRVWFFHQCLSRAGWVLPKVFLICYGHSPPSSLTRRARLFLELFLSVSLGCSGWWHPDQYTEVITKCRDLLLFCPSGPKVPGVCLFFVLFPVSCACLLCYIQGCFPYSWEEYFILNGTRTYASKHLLVLTYVLILYQKFGLTQVCVTYPDAEVCILTLRESCLQWHVGDCALKTYALRSQGIRR